MVCLYELHTVSVTAVITVLRLPNNPMSKASFICCACTLAYLSIVADASQDSSMNSSVTYSMLKKKHTTSKKQPTFCKGNSSCKASKMLNLHNQQANKTNVNQ